MPQVVPMPVGIGPTSVRLKQLLQQRRDPWGNCLLLGLGGSLVPSLQVGDGVLGHQCWVSMGGECELTSACDGELTDWIQRRLGKSVRVGTVVSCDRILCTPQEKQAIHKATQADVVEMEGSAVLTTLAPTPVAILRIISDTHDQTLPDLASAIGPNGEIKSLPLAARFLQQPVAALHLIRGSLRALKRLEVLTTELFNENGA
jgi:nucleoside phosphorylase